MNFLSYVILIAILIAFVWAAKTAFFTRTGRKGGCCDSCSETNCAMRNMASGKKRTKKYS